MSSEKKISPLLKRALEKIEGEGLKLHDLPVERNANDWSTIESGANLTPLELVALKTCRMEIRSAAVADAEDTMASCIAEKVFEKMEIASSSIGFSTVNTKQYQKVTNLLRFKIKGAAWKDKGRIPKTNTPVHTWLDGNEDSPENIEKYMNYIHTELKPKFRWKDEHKYVDCNERGGGLKSLLDTHQFDGQHSTSGNIDVVLVESADKDAMAIKNNIELGLELKHTKNKGEHERQVILQHLAASFLNHQYPVLTLMSDLSTRFTFYWFGKNERIIWKYKASIAEAMYLLDHMFRTNDAGRGDSDEEEIYPKDFLFDERGTWESFNPIKVDTVQEDENEDGPGDDSTGDANHQKEEGNTVGTTRDNTGNPVSDEKEQMQQTTSRSGGRCIGNKYKLGQDELSDILGFDTLEEHEKGDAVLEYLACNVLPNVVSI